MRDYTITKYKNAISELMNKASENNDGIVNRIDFNNLSRVNKITKAMPIYLEKLNIIEQVERNKYKFIKAPTVADIKKIGILQAMGNINYKENKLKNATQMSIETSVPNVNVITTDSDEFARQAMAYLESRGFKVTKEKLNIPIATYKSSIKALTANLHEEQLEKLFYALAKMERDHIYLAYRACESGKYKSPEQYLKDEYNDFTA